MSAIDYLTVNRSAIDRVIATQADEIGRAADLWATTIAGGGLVHVFGSGHSSLVAQDVYGRAGGLVPVNWIVADDLLAFRGMRSSMVERVSGLASVLLSFEPIRTGDVLVVISNSGRNAVPVEMAEVGRSLGLATIAITSLQHSGSVASRAPSGRRLFEIADIVLDNLAVPGDAAISVGDGDGTVMVGATSTVVGTAILQAIAVEATERLAARGYRPAVFTSGNLDDAERRNRDRMVEREGLVPSLMASDFNRAHHGS